jgi:hypothetical protein
MNVDGEKFTKTFIVKNDPANGTTDLDQKAREAFVVDVMDTQAKLAAQVTAFNSKRSAATGAEAERLSALATKLGFPAQGAGGGGRGGRGGRGGGGGPGAALGGIAGAYNGTGTRQGSMLPPTGQMKAELAEAKRVLAELNAELAKK